MTGYPRVVITNRVTGVIAGYATVLAQVADGATGEYIIAEEIVGTQEEIDEILAQSARRMEAINATQSGE